MMVVVQSVGIAPVVTSIVGVLVAIIAFVCLTVYARRMVKRSVAARMADDALLQDRDDDELTPVLAHGRSEDAA